MKKIAILGSTGSIGTQCLDIVKTYSNLFRVDVLTCHSKVDLLYAQAEKFKPSYIVVGTQDAYKKIKNMSFSYPVDISMGMDALNEVVKATDAEVVLNSIMGSAGLLPTINAIKAGKDIALANKETLVTGGKIITKLLQEYNVKMLPVDSEHSGVFQIIQGGNKNIDKIILTASGGPFRGKRKDELINVCAKQALKHPNWDMGRKISIDSATLMNKGLEVIEASWLFNKSVDDIDVIVHPQSIIHAMVKYDDGCLMAQMGSTDMRLPILYAFTYPDRIKAQFTPLDLTEMGQLTFEKPDMDTFPSLKLAYEAARLGGNYPVVLNAANEILVQRFLNDEIGFYDIPSGVEKAMDVFGSRQAVDIDDILQIDKEVRGWMLTLKMR